MNKFYSKNSNHLFSICIFFLFFLNFANSAYADCGERVVSNSYHCTNFVGERSGNNNYVIFLDNSRTGARDYLRNVDLNWQEFSDGTARLSGNVKSNINNDIYKVDVLFTGKTTTQPNGSPYGSECYIINSKNWIYYPNMSGSIESISRNFKMQLTRRGPAFQLGKGASTVQNVLGASGWFDTNSNVFDNGDFNIKVGNFVPNNAGISIDASDTKVCMGKTVRLSSMISNGINSCVIRWQRRPKGGTWANWTTGASPSAAGGFFTAPGVYQFRAVYDCDKANCGASTSNVVNVEVFADPEISISAEALKICLGGNVLISSSLSGGTGSCGIKWQRRPKGGTWKNFNTSATVRPSSYFRSAGVYQFRAIYDCNGASCGASTSNVVDIEVLPDPKISISAEALKICLGGNVLISSSLSGGTGSCGIKWQRRPKGGTWKNFNTSATVRPSSYFRSAGVYQFRAIYDCNGASCGTSTSNVVDIEVLPDPKISISAEALKICLGGNVLISSSLSGGTGSCGIKWQRRPKGGTWKNFNTAATVRPSSYFRSVGVYQFRAIYDCDGASCGASTSNVVNIEVVAAPNATIAKSNDITCAKTETTLTANPSGQSYKWSTGETSRNIKVTSGGIYKVTVTNSSGCKKVVSKKVNEAEVPTEDTVLGGKIEATDCDANGTIIIQNVESPTVPGGFVPETVWITGACNGVGALPAVNVGNIYNEFIAAGGFDAGIDPSIPGTSWEFITDNDGNDLKLTINKRERACYYRCTRVPECDDKFLGESNLLEVFDDCIEDECSAINISSDNTSITVSNLVAPVSAIQILDESNNQVAGCAFNCGEKESFNVPAGNYLVLVKKFNAAFGLICEKIVHKTVGGSLTDDTESSSRNANKGGVLVASNFNPTTNGKMTQAISVFPNPVKNMINVDLSSLAGQNGQLTIFNQMGQLLQTINIGEIDRTPIQVQLQELPTGIYHMTIVANGQLVGNEKFVKQ